jgi:hypothetical protein
MICGSHGSDNELQCFVLDYERFGGTDASAFRTEEYAERRKISETLPHIYSFF